MLPLLYLCLKHTPTVLLDVNGNADPASGLRIT